MEYVVRAVFSGLTLYMLLILLRWLGGAIGFETDYGRWRWIAMLTDPLVDRLRRILPNLGPVDFAPMAALLLVWIIRTLAMPPLIQMGYGNGPS